MTRLFLHASLAGRPVAIAADQVDSVVALEAIVPVPGAPPAVRGLAALRSRVVTVIDPALALGGAHTLVARAVITPVDGQLYALLVDALDDVAPAEQQPPVAGLAPGPDWAAAVAGLVLRDGAPVAVIDPRALIPLPAEPVA